MNNNLDNIAKDLYGKIKTRFPNIKLGDENAEVLSKKEDLKRARFFEFEYEEDGEPLGTIAITLDSDDGIVVQVSGDLVDDDNVPHKRAYEFIRSFRKFAKSRLLNFDVQNIGKSNLDKRDYEFQSKHKEPPIMESKMFGTSRISYQDLGEARLVVKHSQPINSELAAGRTMHIAGIYVENADGERFKYPYKHLPGARALAEHVKHGGNPYDEIGKYITKLSEELGHLRKFKGYVGRQTQISEAMGSVTSRVIDRIEEVKKEIQSLQRPAYYAQFAESFTAKEDRIIPETVMNDWIDRLTIRTFNEEMKSVFPFLYNIVDESDLPICELSANDLLSKSAIKKESTNPIITKTNRFDPESTFESVIEYIVNEDKDEIAGHHSGPALKKLNKILANKVSGGTTGALALKGIIDDPRVVEPIKNIDYQDAYAEDKAVRDIIADYVKSVNPAYLEELPNLYIESPAELGGSDLSPDANSGPDLGEPGGLPAPEGGADSGELGGLGGGGGMPPDLGGAEGGLEGEPPEGSAGASGEIGPAGAAGETPPVAPGEEPAPEELPAEPQAAPVAEGMQHKKNKMKAKFIKAKAAGATLDTTIAEGMTLRDLIRESGMTPAEAGFGEDEDEVDTETLSGVEQILNSIEGFWNKEEKNFTIGGTRVKIIIEKSFEDGEYSNASEDDVKYVMKKVNKLDPPSSSDQEQTDVLRLAGLGLQNSEDEIEDDGQSIDVLMKELQGFGGRRRYDSIDKHKARRTSRNNYERNYRNRSAKFR
jgi:hypothetical protein